MFAAPPFDAFAVRHAKTNGLIDADRDAIERFFHSAATFVCSELLGRLISSYDGVKYDAVNEVVVKSYRMAAAQLGQSALFRLTNQQFEWNTCYIDDVGIYLTSPKAPPAQRLTFLEYLLHHCAPFFQPHWPAVDERLNSLVKAAGLRLSYQRTKFVPVDDERLSAEVSEPFWRLVEAPKWANVRKDMETAFRQRDTGGPNAALMAARAFESTIKIISDQRGATTGKERGAAAFVDTLLRAQFIDGWEANLFKRFFAEVRNPEAHGAGSAPQPSLSDPQTTWAMEFCMISIKGLIRRT